MDLFQIQLISIWNHYLISSTLIFNHFSDILMTIYCSLPIEVALKKRHADTNNMPLVFLQAKGIICLLRGETERSAREVGT